jgi:prepilin peptidase CpaA
MSASEPACIATLCITTAAVCAYTDICRRHIPNVITGTTIAVGLALHGVSAGGYGLGWATAGFAVAFTPALLLYALGGMGGGDVKLLGAIGALTGPLVGGKTLLYSFVFAPLIAVVLLARRRLERRPAAGSLADDGQRLQIPFAVGVALGVLVSLNELGLAALVPAWGSP